MVEHDRIDARLFGALSHLLANGLGRLLARARQLAFAAGRRRQRQALGVINDLGVDVLVGTEHAQARTLGRSGDLGANATPDTGALRDLAGSFCHDSGDALGADGYAVWPRNEWD